MRYVKFLNMNCKKCDVNTFRDLKIGIVDNNHKYDNLVSKIQENYQMEHDISKLLKLLNKDLSYRFRSKFKFDFCLESTLDLDNIKIKKNKKLKKILKEKLFEINDKFSKSKLDLERKLKEN